MKSLILIVFLSSIFILSGCVNDSSKKSSNSESPEVINRLIANNITPASFPSKTQSIITLSYTSVDELLASSCSITQPNQVTVTQACSCDGLGVCVVGVTGVGVYTGAASFSYNVVANGKTSTTGKANFSISAPPAGSNIDPTISAIGAKTTNEGTPVSGIAFTVADSDSTVSCYDVTAASSNTTLLPVANILIAGTAPNCTVTVAPAANQLGSSNITLTLTDHGTPLPAKTAVSTFTLTVNAINDAPVISSIAAQITAEDVPTSAIAFTISDADSTVNCSDVSAVSSNATLVTNSNISIGGSAPNCTATISPNLNRSGSVDITLTLTDHGSPLPVKKATSTFSLNIFPVNDAPIIPAIATQNTIESIAKNVNFTITDVDSNLDCAASVAITSSNTTLVPNTNISVTGIAPNCTASITPAANQFGSANLTVTVSDNGFPLPVQSANTSFSFMVAQVNKAPTISAIANNSTNEDTATSAIAFTIADSDSTIYCNNVTAVSSNTALVPNGNVVISGTAPNCTAVITPVANGTGTSTITLTLNDNGTPMPAMTATTTFTLTVNPVNDTPTISAVANQSTGEGTPSSAIAFTINDIDSTVSCTSGMTATSSNTALIPNANIVFSGSAPNCTAVVTPVAPGFGTATITLRITDNGTPLPTKFATTSFVMTVNEINNAPTISAITTQTTNEDTVKSGIAFTIADIDSTVYCSNVIGTSSNTTLVPNANISITGTAPNCVATITPAADGYGTAAITLTLTDNGTPLPAQTATSVFNLVVSAVNDAPMISAITNKSTDEDVASNAISFTITDSDSALVCNSNVSATSSNQAVIPDANIVISGIAPNCNAVITSASDANGSATITLTVSDNGTPMPAQTASTNFVMTITPVPDLTGTITLANNLGGVASSYLANTYGREMKFAGLTVDEALSTFELCLGTAAGSCDVSDWVEAVGYTTTGSAPTISLGGKYKLVSGANGAQNFTLTPSCSSTTNYYYSVRATNGSNRISNVMSTPAWSFWEPTCLGATVLAQWLDASEPSTISVASGVSVSGWADKSGNGRTVTQNTAGKYPSYNATVMGSLPGLTFNGSTNSMTRAGFAYNFGAASFYSVIKPTAAGFRCVFSEAGNGVANTYYAPLAIRATSNTITGATVGDLGGTPQLNLPDTGLVFYEATGAIKLIMSVDTGTNFSAYSNGVFQPNATTNYVRSSSTINTYRLGSRQINATEASYFTGSIGEFFIFDGSLTTTQRQKLEGYTAHKWGLSANLPGGHPYQVVAP